MSHYHHLEDEKKTGPAIYTDSGHYHFVSGDKTSEVSGSDLDHVHIFQNQVTSKGISEGKSMSVELKFMGGKISSCKEMPNAQGVPVGHVEGYLATWDVDRGDPWGVRDQFVKGCFRESIADHLSRGRNIRLKDSHGRTVGKIPIESVREDERGLWVKGEINLEVQQGRELMSLVRNGDVSDFSIGFSVAKNGATTEGDLRTITKAIIWEGSIVDEPMNPKANITDFKSVVPFQDLPIADRETVWDKTEAITRVRTLTDSEEKPSSTYRRAFLWYDSEMTDVFGGYKLPIADVIDDQLTAVPAAIFAAAAAMRGARGGVNIPEEDRKGVIRHLERYYTKMDMPSPFSEEGKMLAADVKNITPGDLEKALRSGTVFSKEAAKILASRLKTLDKQSDSVDTQQLKSILDTVKSIKA